MRKLSAEIRSDEDTAQVKFTVNADGSIAARDHLGRVGIGRSPGQALDDLRGK